MGVERSMVSLGYSTSDCGADIGLHTSFVRSRCGPPSMEMAFGNLLYREARGMSFLAYRLFDGLFGILGMKSRNEFFTRASNNSHALLASAGACRSMTEGWWQFPIHGWVKVNVDGLVLNSKPRSAIGGVVEAWTLLEGLKYAWAQGYHQVEIESDNSLLIVFIQNWLATTNNYSEVRLI
ncbi:hypothetical protein Gorai_022653 [Gossypium raimondii]|uniref:RNase H type-1 domain-containing protein n=1 Tax=Gossypium raimondii TaxID=29730 RepID=A0A7J8NTX4_GOSRA|nr:hypothetical protein [Gossypium raimondii]